MPPRRPSLPQITVSVDTPPSSGSSTVRTPSTPEGAQPTASSAGSRRRLAHPASVSKTTTASTASRKAPTLLWLLSSIPTRPTLPPSRRLPAVLRTLSLDRPAPTSQRPPARPLVPLSSSRSSTKARLFSAEKSPMRLSRSSSKATLSPSSPPSAKRPPPRSSAPASRTTSSTSTRPVPTLTMASLRSLRRPPWTSRARLCSSTFRALRTASCPTLGSRRVSSPRVSSSPWERET
mmetsp:Transcript_2490/g.3655  ORF Transcript_2490/g.3655 Transcript_2490/m.3655 type:complete len:235 (+) Transcript_2490:266-970(+)